MKIKKWVTITILPKAKFVHRANCTFLGGSAYLLRLTKSPPHQRKAQRRAYTMALFRSGSLQWTLPYFHPPLSCSLHFRWPLRSLAVRHRRRKRLALPQHTALPLTPSPYFPLPLSCSFYLLCFRCPLCSLGYEGRRRRGTA